MELGLVRESGVAGKQRSTAAVQSAGARLRAMGLRYHLRACGGRHIVWLMRLIRTGFIVGLVAGVMAADSASAQRAAQPKAPGKGK